MSSIFVHDSSSGTKAAGGHGIRRTSAPLSRTRTVRPQMIVAAAAPRSVHPSNGVFFDRDTQRDATIVTRASGASTAMSATVPGASVPPGRRRIRAGFVDSSSIARPSVMSAGMHQPVEHERHAGLEADDPERRLIEFDCPSRRRDAAHDRWRWRRRSRRTIPSIIASTSADSRSGGFILQLVSYWIGASRASSVRVKWCGATSQVTRDPATFPSRTARRAPRALMCAIWTRPRVRPASVTSRCDHDRLPPLPAGPQAQGRGLETLVRDAVTLERRVLAVVDHRQVEHRRVLEGAPHQQRRGHRAGHRRRWRRSRRLELRDVREQLARRAARDGANRIDARQSGLARLLRG